MKIIQKTSLIIILTTIGFLIQLHIQSSYPREYNYFLLKYTINPHSEIISLLTNIFLHANILHIGMNMFMLFLLSKMFNEKSSFFTIYILSGLLGSLFSLFYVYFISPAYVLGASGAIFGLFSYILFKQNRRKEFYLNFLIFNGGMILFNFPIAWYAHLGGAISGILYYYYENDILPKIKRKKMRRV